MSDSNAIEAKERVLTTSLSPKVEQQASLEMLPDAKTERLAVVRQGLNDILKQRGNPGMPLQKDVALHEIRTERRNARPFGKQIEYWVARNGARFLTSPLFTHTLNPSSPNIFSQAWQAVRQRIIGH